MLELLFAEVDGKAMDESALPLSYRANGHLGGRELNKDTGAPITEVLKGSEWLVPVGKSGSKQAFDGGLKGMVSDHLIAPITNSIGDTP